MKILVVQLARLGDIYQTWPTLHALRRKNPGAEIHLLTRSTFAGAIPKGFIDRHLALDTRDVLGPLIDEKPAIDTSLLKLDEFCEGVRAEKYHRIINLSFSAFSSYLVSQLESSATEVSGYSRFNDGYLRIPDDGSAYFYAQVGVGQSNRFHVTDLFAHVAGVDLIAEDWEFNKIPSRDRAAVILIHVGASDLSKTLSSGKWQQVVKGLIGRWSGQVVLVGSVAERDFASQIAAISGDRQPVNLVGETRLDEVFAMVSEACLLIGGDSAPVQIASLTGTPVLNVSLPIVSFWETGPRSKGSRILTIPSEDAISAEEIVNESLALLNGQATTGATVRVLGPTLPFVEMRPQPRAFEWEILRALYMGEKFPEPASDLFLLGIKRLQDVNTLALEQLDALRRNPQNKTASTIIDRVDELMEQITQQQMVPEATPIVRWFQTERSRIGPMLIEDLIEATSAVHQRLRDVLSVYVNSGGSESEQALEDGGNNDGVILDKR
jgi:ADP-heptose:LPS heptosyltransferase